jgi:hypothetical protein
MTFSDVVSQSAYALAAVLLISGVTKMSDLTRLPAPSSSNAEDPEFHSLLSNKKFLGVLSVIELIIGVSVALTFHSSEGIRDMAVKGMALLFVVFAIGCWFFLATGYNQNCRLFWCSLARRDADVALCAQCVLSCGRNCCYFCRASELVDCRSCPELCLTRWHFCPRNPIALFYGSYRKIRVN